MTTASALMHPVRLRIVQALMGGRQLTTQQLHRSLPDIPIATLYRQIAFLGEHNVLDVAEETKIGGAQEKTYRLAPQLANPTPDEVRSLSSDELETVFAVFVSGLTRDFATYLKNEPYDLEADRVGFSQARFWASAEEMDELYASIMDALQRVMNLPEAAHRRQRLLNTISMPAEPSVPSSGSNTQDQEGDDRDDR